jgi:molybdate transport system substrate-binding protein
VPIADAEPRNGTVLVSAAASTRELLTELASQFSESSGTEIKLNTGPSSGLANQIIAGAPADLFLSANTQWAAEVDKAGLAEEQVPLLTNRLALVVPAGNPGAVSKPEDLQSDKVQKVALAGESVPAGMYADQALGKLELLASLTEAGKIVRGQDVRTALSYVERGEAEAGIVYTTDLSAATGVENVYEFDSSLHDPIVYVLVNLKTSEPKPAADKFFDYLQSSEADGVYARFGFTRLPDEPAAPADTP